MRESTIYFSKIFKKIITYEDDDYWIHFINSHNLNNVETKVFSGDTIHVPCGTKHRLKNIGEEELIFIEIQRGEYFGEDDIVRLADDYKRD